MKAIEWPQIFVDGKLPKDATDESLVADGIIGWANCTLVGLEGGTLPKEFGLGMAAIGTKLGICASYDDLEKYGQDKGWIKK